MSFEHNYSDTFYNYIEQGSLRSASVIAPLAMSHIKFNSLVDLGCGRGAWLTVFKKLGIKDVLGIDGEYVSIDNILVERDEFYPFNLSRDISLDRNFELVMSLEVAEHLPETSANTFVKNLTKLGDVVLFSAAVTGQGGEYHVNEQPLEYWKEKFEREGYSCYDLLRNIIRYDEGVMKWYRYNTLIYANEAGKGRLSSELVRSLVPQGQAVKNIQSISWKIRLFLVRHLPKKVSTWLAQVNSHRLASKAQQ